MSDVLICPDCGGVIGATEPSEHGHPCRCAPVDTPSAPVAPAGATKRPSIFDDVEPDPQSPDAQSPDPLAALDSSPAVPSPMEETSGVEAGPPKLCVLCGKDVRGHRRLKDSRGYVCYDCAKEERRKERGDRVRCSQCEKMLKPEVMQDYEGLRLCPDCHRERAKATATVIKKIGFKSAYERTERERILLMVFVALILLALPLLYRLFSHR